MFVCDRLFISIRMDVFDCPTFVVCLSAITGLRFVAFGTLVTTDFNFLFFCFCGFITFPSFEELASTSQKAAISSGPKPENSESESALRLVIERTLSSSVAIRKYFRTDNTYSLHYVLSWLQHHVFFKYTPII
ncbi:hypothetical protein CHS0354_022138 [Potamilus streckersoni]|uniref:Uncharacterized protein n=1 Tax=Potamilus streckersoni TaxID=2493646 RepID=A0AAE0VI40_9BIVA|nr:hypothetical protein CHS0354_022138 [Potamilus streckersoni]